MQRRQFLACSAVAASCTAVPQLMAAEGKPARYDVIVYSGVPCGIAAAVAAAREGAKVLLLEPTMHVGGMNTSGINTAESEHMLLWTIGGLALEFYTRLGKHYGSGKPEFYFESSVAEKVFLAMLAEAGVDTRFGQAVESVELDDALHIRRVTLIDGSELAARSFVDASYEGDLMARTPGVSYTWGRESRDEYDEEAAGIRFDKKPRRAATVAASGKLLPGISAFAKDLRAGDSHPGVMNYNFRLCCTKHGDNKAPIPEPDDYDRGRYQLLANWLEERKAADGKLALRDFFGTYPRRHHKFEVNNQQDAIISLGHFGGQFGWPDGSYDERRKIFADHKNYTLGLLHFLRTEACVPEPIQQEIKAWGFAKDEFTDNDHFPYQLYVREARRLKGIAVVTQRDVTTDRRKDDAIGISSHFIDSHHVQRVALSPTEFVNEGRIWRIGWAYQIPYRALLPRPDQCKNLLVAGAASFSHVAFCSYRLESVWMIAGQAAGLAAALAAKAGSAVQDVEVATLQKQLRAQQQVVDFREGQPERFTGGNGGHAEF